MKIVNPPNEELRLKICKNSEYIYRQEQSKSNLKNHKEFGEAWIQGFKYGVELVCVSFDPAEAQARLNLITEIKNNIEEIERKIKREVSDSKNKINYYFNNQGE